MRFRRRGFGLEPPSVPARSLEEVQAMFSKAGIADTSSQLTTRPAVGLGVVLYWKDLPLDDIAMLRDLPG